jgi:hypothetical protein
MLCPRRGPYPNRVHRNLGVTMKPLVNATLVAAAMICLASAAGADVITITFDDVPLDIQCDEVWYEQEIPMWFTTAVAGECGEGSCFFGVEAGLVWLYPSTLALNLSGVLNIISIEMDYIDACPGSCENAYLYNGAVLVDEDHGDTNPLVVETGGSPVTLLRVNGCEDAITEIRIIGDNLVSTESSTWGAIKAFYR